MQFYEAGTSYLIMPMIRTWPTRNSSPFYHYILNGTNCNIVKDAKLFWIDLKVVCATFLLVRFVYLKYSTCETRKNVFYFTLKALFVLEIIKFSTFQVFKCHGTKQVLNTKQNLLNNLRSKHNLVMKFGQFI